MPRSSNAMVVPTGLTSLPSPSFMSATAAKDLPLSITKPSKLNSVPDGSLYGSVIRDARRSPAGASTSLNSPGTSG
jgi:hypothetical protein